MSEDELLRIDVFAKMNNIDKSEAVRRLLNESLNKHIDTKSLIAKYKEELRIVNLQIATIEEEERNSLL